MQHRLVIAVSIALGLVVLTPLAMAVNDNHAVAIAQSTDSTATTAAAENKDTATTPPAAKRESKIVRMLGGGPDQVKLTPDEQKFVEMTNADRKAHKLKELTVAPLLESVAREKSKEMHDLKYWGHQSPIAEKRTAMRRVLFYLPEPPESLTVGENLCYSPRIDVEAGHKALMNSPTHRRNILNPVYQYVGIGTYIADDGRAWTTEIFLTASY
ncbi:MAG: CAP domain-containing protein [Armatimonadota bacterium]